MEPLRWGILGAARIANSALAPAIRDSRNGRLVAVASRSPERAADFAARHGIPRHYGGYDELLADPEVEAVYNPLPNSEHLPLTLRALAAGKHVLCEKPLALNAAEAERMDVAAREAGLVLLEAFSYRFHPQVERALDLVRSGAVGELRLVTGSFRFKLERPGDIRFVHELGGGALYDVGCYPVNAARLAVGREPLRVSGFADRAPGNVDDTFLGHLDFGDGVRSSFDCSFSLHRGQRLEFVGTSGTVVLNAPFTPGKGDVTVLVNGEAETVPGTDQYRLMAEHFVDAVRGEVPLRYPASEAVAQMKVLDALYESARVGPPVEPGSLP